MGNESNQNNPIRISAGLAEKVLLTQPQSPDRSVMLNGGNPIQIGFNTNLNFKPINKDSFKATVEKADKKLFPAGLKGLPAGFYDFISKAEGPLFQWLGTKQNLALFTANPVKAMLKFCDEKKMPMPADIKDFLTKTQKSYAAIKYNVPGVRFNKVTASLNQNRK